MEHFEEANISLHLRYLTLLRVGKEEAEVVLGGQASLARPRDVSISAKNATLIRLDHSYRVLPTIASLVEVFLAEAISAATI